MGKCAAGSAARLSFVFGSSAAAIQVEGALRLPIGGRFVLASRLPNPSRGADGALSAEQKWAVRVGAGGRPCSSSPGPLKSEEQPEAALQGRAESVGVSDTKERVCVTWSGESET